MIYAPRFLPTLGYPHAVALHFAHCGQLTAGLAPAGVRPCWAHHKKAPVEHRGFCPSGFPTRVPNCATPRPGGSRADQLALASCAPVAALLHGWASTHRRDAPPDFGTSGRRMPPSSTSCCVKQLTCSDHHARTRFNWTLAGAALRIIRTQDTSSVRHLTQAEMPQAFAVASRQQDPCPRPAALL